MFASGGGGGGSSITGSDAAAAAGATRFNQANDVALETILADLMSSLDALDDLRRRRAIGLIDPNEAWFGQQSGREADAEPSLTRRPSTLSARRRSTRFFAKLLADGDLGDDTIVVPPTLPAVGSLGASDSAVGSVGSIRAAVVGIEETYTVPLTRLRRAFDCQSSCGRFHGMPEADFVRFIAPALTRTRDPSPNAELAAQLDAADTGHIQWDAFSTFFVSRGRPEEAAPLQLNIIGPATQRAHHHSMISRILFPCSHPEQGSWNAMMDRYCFTGGFDGSVHKWETSFMDHVSRIHSVPDGKGRRWINDMCFTNAGRLAIAQSYGYVYLYNVHPDSHTLHRVLRGGRQEDALASAKIGAGSRDGLMLGFRPPSGASSRGFIGHGARSGRYGGGGVGAGGDMFDAGVCVLSGVAGDVVCIAGCRTRGLVGSGGGAEPMLVGDENGTIHLFNTYKPVDQMACITPVATWSHFAKGRPYQIMEDPLNGTFVSLGKDHTDNHFLQFVDFDKGLPTIRLQHPSGAGGGCGSSGPVLTRFDFDPAASLIAASGPGRVVTLFTGAFPNPIGALREHQTPVVDTMLQLSNNVIYTVTEDKTFHVYDSRMLRKLQTIPDREQRWPENRYSAAALDGIRGCPVAASNCPIALRETSGVSATGGSGGATAAVGSGGGGPSASGGGSHVAGGLPSPSGFAATLAGVDYAAAGEAVITAEGNCLVVWPPTAAAESAASGDHALSAGIGAAGAGFGGRRGAADDTGQPAGRNVSVFSSALAGATSNAVCAPLLSAPPAHNPRRIFDMDHPIVRIATDRSGRRCAVALGRNVHVVSTVTGAELFVCRLPTGSPDDVYMCDFFAAQATDSGYVLLGTLHGNLHVFGDPGGAEMRVLSFGRHGVVSALVAAPACGKIFLGFMDGTVLSLAVETFSATQVTSYAQLLATPASPMSSPRVVAVSSGSNGSPVDTTGVSPQVPGGKRPTASSTTVEDSTPRSAAAATAASPDFETFQLKSVSALDVTVEGTTLVDPQHVALLFGAGLLALVRTSVHEDTVVVMSERVLEPGVSGSAIAAHAATHQIAIGDFAGCVTFLSLRRYFESISLDAKSAQAGVRTRAPSRRTIGRSMELRTVACVIPDELISQVVFVAPTRVAAALLERAAVAIVSAEGGGVLRWIGSPLGSVPIGVPLGTQASGPGATSSELPSTKHPLVMRAAAAARRLAANGDVAGASATVSGLRGGPGGVPASSTTAATAGPPERPETQTAASTGVGGGSFALAEPCVGFAVAAMAASAFPNPAQRQQNQRTEQERALLWSSSSDEDDDEELRRRPGSPTSRRSHSRNSRSGIQPVRCRGSVRLQPSSGTPAFIHRASLVGALSGGVLPPAGLPSPIAAAAAAVSPRDAQQPTTTALGRRSSGDGSFVPPDKSRRTSLVPPLMLTALRVVEERASHLQQQHQTEADGSSGRTPPLLRLSRTAGHRVGMGAKGPPGGHSLWWPASDEAMPPRSGVPCTGRIANGVASASAIAASETLRPSSGRVAAATSRPAVSAQLVSLGSIVDVGAQAASLTTPAKSVMTTESVMRPPVTGSQRPAGLHGREEQQSLGAVAQLVGSDAMGGNAERASCERSPQQQTRYVRAVSPRAVIMTHDVFWAQPPQLVHPPRRPVTPEFRCERRAVQTTSANEAVLKRAMEGAEAIAARIASALKMRHRQTRSSNGGQRVFRGLRVDFGRVEEVPVLKHAVDRATRFPAGGGGARSRVPHPPQRD